MGYSLENQHKRKSFSAQISAAWKPWRKALSVQRQTLVALIFRETKTRFGEQSLGILWAFGETLSHIFVFWGIWAIMGRQAHGGLIVPIFLVSGMVPFFMFKNIFNKSADCINANRALLVFSQINILDFALSRAIVELMIYAAAIVIFILTLFFFEFNFYLHSVLPIINGFIILWLLGIGMGLMYLPFKGQFKIIDTIIDIVFRALYFTSGVIFPLDRIPNWAREYLQYNPILHILEYMRTAFNPEYGLFLNVSYSIQFTVFGLMIGMILLRKLRKMILNND